MSSVPVVVVIAFGTSKKTWFPVDVVVVVVFVSPSADKLVDVL